LSKIYRKTGEVIREKLGENAHPVIDFAG